MNVQAQVPGRVPNQGNLQLAGLSQHNGMAFPSQMHGLTAHGMDCDVEMYRQRMRTTITQILQRRINSPNPGVQRLPELAKRLEDTIFRDAASMDAYVNMTVGAIEQRLQAILRNLANTSHRSSHHTSSSSSISTMMPTPGMPHNLNTNTSAVARHNASFNASDGLIPNRYQQSSPNMALGSGGNSMISSIGISRQLSQMIPTPGLNNPQQVSRSSGPSHGVGFSSLESTMVSQQEQKQYVGRQNSRILHTLGGQIGVDLRSNLQQKPSAYGFPNSTMNGSLGMMSNNMHMMTRPATSDSYLNATSYASSPKPLHHQFDQQHHQLIVPTSLPHQILPMAGDGYGMSTVVPSVSGNFYGSASSVSSSMNSQNVKSMSLHSNTSLLPMQPSPLVKSQIYDNSQQMNFQESQPSREQIQTFQHQSNLGRLSMASNFGGQLMSDHDIASGDELLFPQAGEEFHLQELQNEYNSLLTGAQHDALEQGNWHPRPSQGPQMPDKLSFEKYTQEEFQQRLIGQDEAQQPCFNGSTTVPAASKHSVSTPQSSSGVACGPGNATREVDYLRQRRWLLFWIHARFCPAPKGACKEVNCLKAQQLFKHISECNLKQCERHYCCPSKKLFEHFRNCRSADCPVCVPVRDYITSKSTAQSCRPSDIVVAEQVSDSWINEASEDLQPPKRIKRESSPVSVPALNQPHASENSQPQMADMALSTRSEAVEVNMDSPAELGKENPSIFGNTVNHKVHSAKLDTDPLGLAKEEALLIKTDDDKVTMEVKQDANSPAEPVVGSKSGKPKIKGVSLIELFTPEQIREHVRSLKQWTGQTKAKAEKNQAMESSMGDNSCQLCAVENLVFDPPPVYCTPCGARIKRNAIYYTIGTGDTRYYFCVLCYSQFRGDTISVDAARFPKVRLEKKKNAECIDEGWVECDKCNAWQHQICGLFNGRMDDEGQAEFTCPTCYIKEIERGERQPLPSSAVLGAKDLPRTTLSDHIEQRLFRRLKQERQDRAKQLGKSFDEVPEVESLVIRVVSSVDKKLDVKQRFSEIFQEENYPTEFPYKSKVILMFQTIDGVDVCIYGMYVQEYGSECQFPNQRCVYISYLDSVKYFRPDIKTGTGKALRTFVYHEILIGYLDFSKKRGFARCYIWACPPMKGEDYILYCHPEIQKTPRSDKLREWYLSMLRKAAKEDIVVDVVNIYDHCFVSHGECKAKVTAARLPYFDGDYWPGAAEEMINQLREEENGRNQQKKGRTKKTLSKRALKAAGQTDLTGNASKDALLMHRLGETIYPMKEDFIMVHLQHACTHCCLLMVSGTRWVCKQCKNFQLCDKCHDAEQRLQERDRHPINSRDTHMLCPVEITGVPSDTKDKDEILESEIFDTRQAFLGLCQGNRYQYDTLRRAKHSSMMILYHLHNPTAPAFLTTCNVCHQDVETGQGWHCEICPDFDVCNACYQKEGGVDHPHNLTNHQSVADSDAQNQEIRKKRGLQLRKMLDLLVHSSKCPSPSCLYPNCRKVKSLFRHGMHCKLRVSGGCRLCKNMWNLLHLHARACKESNCDVPRCKDLKEHMKRSQQQADTRRRAAVKEMVRQRAAEEAGTTN